MHFDETGRKFPLAVKLGTITPKGADVFSYAPNENDMVLDKRLEAHLAHWGINMVQMEKTEKTMTELQIDLNLKHEFDAITEDGASLTPLSGPGYVGLQNLGNSCYLNATLQALCVVPAFTRQYADRHGELIRLIPLSSLSFMDVGWLHCALCYDFVVVGLRFVSERCHRAHR